MKYIFLTLAVVLTFNVTAQLNTEAKAVQKAMPEEYHQIRCMAVNKWDDNHKMVVYEINLQSEAFVSVMDVLGNYDDPDIEYRIMIQAMTKWKLDECVQENGDPSYNWKMVVYEYGNQLQNTNY